MMPQPFKDRLTTCYGPQILLDFEQATINIHYSLADIGRKYGFTRERARQMFNQLYSFPYRAHQGDLHRNISNLVSEAQYKPHFLALAGQYFTGNRQKNVQAKLKAYKRLQESGFKPIIMAHSGSDFWLERQNCLIKVKSSSTACYPTKHNKTAYHHFWIKSDWQLGHIDFFLAYVFPQDCFYVIPRSAIQNKHFNIPAEMDNLSNKWIKYRENWGLLR